MSMLNKLPPRTNWDGMNRNDRALEFMDFVLTKLPLAKPFSILDFEMSAGLERNEQLQFRELRYNIRSLLLRFQYAQKAAAVLGHLELTLKGMEAKEDGGHFAYEKRMREEARHLLERYGSDNI